MLEDSLFIVEIAAFASWLTVRCLKDSPRQTWWMKAILALVFTAIITFINWAVPIAAPYGLGWKECIGIGGMAYLLAMGMVYRGKWALAILKKWLEHRWPNGPGAGLMACALGLFFLSTPSFAYQDDTYQVGGGGSVLAATFHNPGQPQLTGRYLTEETQHQDTTRISKFKTQFLQRRQVGRSYTVDIVDVVVLNLFGIVQGILLADILTGAKLLDWSEINWEWFPRRSDE